eukprot:395774-Pleurochrysis_carterae.AAC.1
MACGRGRRGGVGSRETGWVGAKESSCTLVRGFRAPTFTLISGDCRDAASASAAPASAETFELLYAADLGDC